jgi:tetratricopeptide (TPR) repeat protein
MKRSSFGIAVAGVVMLAGFGFTVMSIPRPALVDARAMSAANELVAAGHYAEAAQMYEQQIAQGAQDAALYHNLGNATLALGDAGRAAAAYEQAAALAPRDADIRANLALAQQQLRGQARTAPAQRPAGTLANLPVAQQQARGLISTGSAGPLGGLADVTSRWLTVDELALLALGAWLALGLLVFAYRGLQPERRSAVARAAVAMAFVVVLATGAGLASRLSAPQLALPAVTGQPPAGNGGQQVAAPTHISNPL